MQERFHHIFGLSRTVPPCATEDQKVAITVSDSGLYLDEMDELNLKMVPAAQDCKDFALVENSIWLLMERARNNALKAMETDLITGLHTINKLKREPFTGFLGSAAKVGYMPGLVEGQLVTTTLKTNALAGNIVRIKTIGLHASVSTLVPVNINGQSVEVSTTAHTLKQNTLAEPVEIPLTGEDIVITYVVEGFMVGNNKMCYGCAGTLRKLVPYFPQIDGQEANGLVLNIEITCQPDNVIYENYRNRQDIKNVLGYAARFKSAELLLERILNSSEITRYTMMDNQYLWGKRNHFRKEYQDRLNWLVSTDGFDLTHDNCYSCKPPQGFAKRGILI